VRARKKWSRLIAGAVVALGAFANSAAATKDWSGTYLMFQQAASVTELPVISDVVAKVRTTMLVEVAQDGTRVKGKGKVCHMQIVSSSSLVETELPPAFRRAVPPVVFTGEITSKNGKTVYKQDPRTVVLGARLKKKTDPLPKSSKDRRVYDHDRDGNPGVTVKVSGFVSGEVYLVQRSTSRLNGEQRGNGFKGSLWFANEQNILGASSSVLDRDTGAKPDLKRSYFVMQSVPKKLSCADAVRMARNY